MNEKEIEQSDCAHTFEKFLASYRGNGKWVIYYKCPKCKKVKRGRK